MNVVQQEQKQEDVIRKLLVVQPEITGRLPLIEPNRCIAETAVAIQVLDRLNISAKPLPVRVVIFNAATLARLTTGQDELPPATWQKAGWHGHLVVGLIGTGRILDMNTGQFCWPKKNIELPPAMEFNFPGTEATYNVNGVRMTYTALPDDRSYEDTPDWRFAVKRIGGATELICLDFLIDYIVNLLS